MSPQIATNTVVTRDELLDFVRPRHHAIVITARSDTLRQGKSLLRVTPRRWGPVATGGFPPELA